MDDRRPGIVIWLNPGCGASAHTDRPRKTGWVCFNGPFASLFATPTRMGDHEALEAGGALVEVE